MTGGLTRAQLGVTDAMIASYGETIFKLSNNHQIRLTRRRAEHLGTEPRQVVARHGGGNHFDGATSQAKPKRP